MTLVSEVETESIDRPCRAKTVKASARKPTSCHMPTVSIEISVMPLREEIALTCGPPAAPTAEITVPGASGRSVAQDVERDAVPAQRRDAARMEHLGPHGGDLLRLVVVEGAQQPGRGEERGLAVNRPGTSVQISHRAAPRRAAK